MVGPLKVARLNVGPLTNCGPLFRRVPKIATVSYRLLENIWASARYSDLFP